MVELTSVLGYGIMVFIPLLIVGFGSMIKENKVTTILALINFISLSTYFRYIGYVSGWVIGIMYAMIGFIMVLLFRAIFSGAE